MLECQIVLISLVWFKRQTLQTSDLRGRQWIPVNVTLKHPNVKVQSIDLVVQLVPKFRAIQYANAI